MHLHEEESIARDSNELARSCGRISARRSLGSVQLIQGTDGQSKEEPDEKLHVNGNEHQ